MEPACGGVLVYFAQHEKEFIARGGIWIRRQRHGPEFARGSEGKDALSR